MYNSRNLFQPQPYLTIKREKKLNQIRTTSNVLIFCLLIISFTIISGSVFSAESPVYCSGLHNVGQLSFGITNYGTIGRPPFRDCFTNKKILMAEFPRKSRTVHLYKAGLWVGAVVGRDTLVSTAAETNISNREFNPDVPPLGDISYRSSTDPSNPGYEKAVSEQDFIAVYTDTFTSGVPDLGFDAADFRRHRPLGIEVTQSSYAWSYDYTEDFVLIDYFIRNIGENVLKDVYIGIYMDADVHEDVINQSVNPTPDLPFKEPTEGIDDLGGFIRNYTTIEGECEITHNLNLAWTADNDGDARGANFIAPNIVGMRYLGKPGFDEKLGFNWWIFNSNSRFDFGPQHKQNFRYMGNGAGTPIGDRSKYHLLSNGEIDYDQAFASSISPFNPTWIRPDPRISRIWSSANDIQWLLSIGPYTLQPGSKVSFPLAYVGGEKLHTNAFVWRRYLAHNNDPRRFYSFLDFSDLGNNAIWAGWVYDNPGVDTDGDGYFGDFAVCILDTVLIDSIWVPSVAETTFYTGDGVADWRGAAPPPAPKVWLSQAVNGLKVRFNGGRSETTKDIFSGIIDFEGYNVYIGRDDRESSLSLVASYDRENFRKFIYNPNLKPRPGYVMEVRAPYTLEELRCAYGKFPNPCGDSIFNPLNYRPASPYIHPFHPDSVFYFAKHGSNADQFGSTTPIVKRFPNQLLPSIPPVPDDYTDDGYFKYYDYEFEINNLLATVPYYMNVTAFDFGSPEAGLDPLETSKVLGAAEAFVSGSAGALDDEFTDIYVYPNPYRNDIDYRGQGFEGLTQDNLPRDKVRAIHFANLPPKCTIRIFSLDGDLIRRLSHDVSPSDPTSTHAQWDLISRNRQLIVSGLYYWSVEMPDGSTQIGNFAVIM